jgi:hypothetical protein
LQILAVRPAAGAGDDLAEQREGEVRVVPELTRSQDALRLCEAVEQLLA